MSALFILIGISLAVALAFLIAFLWSVRDGQYDDDYTPSVRMLFDETPAATKRTPIVQHSIAYTQPTTNTTTTTKQ